MTRNERRRQIATVVARHGLHQLLAVAGLGASRSGAGPTRPRELRLALQELGPTFIKLGQLVSTRADLLGEEYRDELAKLQDSIPPVSGDAIWRTVDAELHGDADAAFARFDREPLAVASIGQAHLAALADGTEVVVKVRRPGVEEQIELDLGILEECAGSASRHWKALASVDVHGAVDEFARLLRSELDYVEEGRNADRFGANFAGDPDVQIPRVFWETTTPRVITLERIQGLKVNDVDALVTAGIDTHALAERAMKITAKMVFEDEFFHGDPHPGNFFIEPGGRIGLIDFGIVGSLDDRLRDELGKILVAIVRQDAGRFADALLGLGTSTGPVDRSELRTDFASLFSRYAGRSLGEISLGAAISEFQEIARRHRLRLPGTLALLVKVLTMGEGMATDLDPGFRLGEALAPYARRAMLAQLDPRALEQRLEQLALDVPGRLQRLFEILDDGEIELRLRVRDLEPLVTRLERVGTRIAAAVLVGAILNATATRRKR